MYIEDEDYDELVAENNEMYEINQVLQSELENSRSFFLAITTLETVLIILLFVALWIVSK